MTISLFSSLSGTLTDGPNLIKNWWTSGSFAALWLPPRGIFFGAVPSSLLFPCPRRRKVEVDEGGNWWLCLEKNISEWIIFVSGPIYYDNISLLTFWFRNIADFRCFTVGYRQALGIVSQILRYSPTPIIQHPSTLQLLSIEKQIENSLVLVLHLQQEGHSLFGIHSTNQCEKISDIRNRIYWKRPRLYMMSSQLAPFTPPATTDCVSSLAF